MKLELLSSEVKRLLREIESEDLVNYRSLNNLMKIHQQHINVRFDPEIWLIYGKQLVPSVVDGLNRNLDFIREPLVKVLTESNPLVNSQFLEELLYQFKDDFSPKEITQIMVYGIVGSCNSPSQMSSTLNEINTNPA